jgi:hypothetical protein
MRIALPSSIASAGSAFAISIAFQLTIQPGKSAVVQRGFPTKWVSGCHPSALKPTPKMSGLEPQQTGVATDAPHWNHRSTRSWKPKCRNSRQTVPASAPSSAEEARRPTSDTGSIGGTAIP